MKKFISTLIIFVAAATLVSCESESNKRMKQLQQLQKQFYNRDSQNLDNA